MPLIDAGFKKQNGDVDHDQLINNGPTLQVWVSDFLPNSQVRRDPSSSKIESVSALIDTGASVSCIDSELAKALDLVPVDIATISGAGGAKQHLVYLASIVIPQLEIVQYGKFTGVELKTGGQSHGVLLGRGFLKNVIMIYDGTRGQVTVASAKTEKGLELVVS